MAFINYSTFAQRIRRHRPSELLQALAVTALEFAEKDRRTADRVRLPWAIAAAAKTSIVAGNEHRRAGVTARDVMEICSSYNDLYSPLRPDPADTSETIGAFFLRTAHQQFVYQHSHFEEICRLGALFDGVEELDTEILDSALIQRILGCSLDDFVVAGLVLAVAAQSNAGFFDPDWPALREGVGAIAPHYSIDTVNHVFSEHFLTSFAEFRMSAESARQPDERLRHLEFNPLVSRPFVTLVDGRHLAPQPHLVFQRLSPAALYYAGVAALEEADVNAFTRDIGLVFQDYVGRQLRLMTSAAVLPEIVFDGDQRSVDWIVIFDRLVMLVEVKSTRLSHLARVGGDRLVPDIERSIGKAYAQVRRSDALISARHPAFGAIPNDRPRVAVIVTLEPYYMANNPFMAELLPDPVMPTTVASARAVEHLVDVVAKVGPQPLIDVLSDQQRRTWNLENALPEIDLPRNPLLDAAWRRYPFPAPE